MNPKSVIDYLRESALGTVNHAKTFLVILWNKGLILLTFFLLLRYWRSIPPTEEVPFAELIYAAIIITGILATVPIIRFLMFPETSEYAERGWLKNDTNEGAFQSTAALRHYWFTTGICFLVVIVSIIAMTKK